MINEKYSDREITILSHSNPDVDSIISGFLLEKLLRSKGYNASYIIPDKNINEESYTLCKKYGLDPKKYQGRINEKGILFLVDHYITTFNGETVGIIDHHPTSRDINCDTYINKSSSSTAMIIYNLEPSLFNRDDIEKVVLANFVDTICFNSDKSILTDKEWTIKAIKEYNFNYDNLYNDGLCLTDISDLKKAIAHGEKNYAFNNKRIISTYIQVNSINNEVIDNMLNMIKQKLITNNLDMWVFIIHDMTIFKTSAYLITGAGCEIINYDKITSRGTTIMPSIEKRFLNI